MKENSETYYVDLDIRVGGMRVQRELLPTLHTMLGEFTSKLRDEMHSIQWLGSGSPVVTLNLKEERSYQSPSGKGTTESG